YYLSTGTVDHRALNAHGEIQAAAIAEAADGAERATRVAVANTAGTVTIYELGGYGTQADGVKLTDLPRSATRLAFSHDGMRLAAALNDGSVRVWALAGGVWIEVLSGLMPAGPESPTGLAFSSDGKALAIAGRRKVVVYGLIE